MKKRIISILAFAFHLGFSQPLDSTQVFSLKDVVALAKENHPMIRQASLQVDFARAELIKSKGNLDPKMSSSFSAKELKGTSYYDKFSGSLKIPTWFPVDPKVELYKNNGSYLNPENYVSGASNYWQVTTGISLPVGKGLFIDERRSMIKQAQLLETMAEADRNKLINSTLLVIIESYWNWYQAQQQFELMYHQPHR